MPRIPLSDRAGFVAGEAPVGPAPRASGLIEGAVSQAGRALSEIGVRNLAARKRADDEDYINKTVTDASIQAKKDLIELQNNAPEDGGDIDLQHKRNMSEAFKRVQEVAPSESARRRASRALTLAFQDSNLKAEAFVRGRKKGAYITKSKQNVSEIVNLALVSSDITEIQTLTNEELNNINNAESVGRIDSATAGVMRRETKTNIANGMIRSYRTSADENTMRVGIGVITAALGERLPEQEGKIMLASADVENLIDGKESDFSIGSAIPPSDAEIKSAQDLFRNVSPPVLRAELLALRNKLEQKKKENLFRLDGRVKDAIDAELVLGRDVSDDQIIGLKKELLSSFKEPIKAVVPILKLESANVMGNILRRSPLMTPKEILNIGEVYDKAMDAQVEELKKLVPELKTLNTRNAASSIRARDLRILKTRLTNNARQIEEDAPQFFSAHDPEVRNASMMALSGEKSDIKNYTDTLRNRYRVSGVPKASQKLLTQPMAEHYGTLLGRSIKDDPAAGPSAVDIFDQLDQGWGDDFPKILSEIEKQGGVDSSILLASFPVTKSGKQRIFENSRIKTKDLKDTYETVNGGGSWKDLKAAVSTEIRETASAIAGYNPSGGATSLVNSLVENVLKEAGKDPSKSPKDAAKSAADAVVRSSFSTFTANGSPIFNSGGVSFLTPKAVRDTDGQMIPVKPPVIDAFVESHLTESWVKENLPIPQFYKDEFIKRGFKDRGQRGRFTTLGQGPQNVEESFLLDARQNLKWMPDIENTNQMILMWDPEGGRPFPVPGKDGNVMTQSYLELMKNPDKLTHDRLTSFFNLQPEVN
jgi:hypothetical protein